MPAGDHELELARARFAEQRDGGTAKPARIAAVVLDLVDDRLRVFRAVQAEEDFLDHGLLLFGEKLRELLVGDVPVVIDLGAERMIEWKADGLALGFAQVLVKRRHERLGARPGRGGRAGFGRQHQGDSRSRSNRGDRGFEEFPAGHNTAAVAIRARLGIHGACILPSTGNCQRRKLVKKNLVRPAKDLSKIEFREDATELFAEPKDGVAALRAAADWCLQKIEKTVSLKRTDKRMVEDDFCFSQPVSFPWCERSSVALKTQREGFTIYVSLCGLEPRPKLAARPL
jgi:hypothetical protein